MNLIKLKPSDIFKLESVRMAEDSKGVRRLCCNYELTSGPKGSLRVMFEGYSDASYLRVKPQYPLHSLMRMFDDVRYYVQGVIFSEGQFSDEDTSVSA